MKKYSKSSLNRKRWVKYLIMILSVIIIICIFAIVYINFTNYIVYENINNDAMHISDEKAEKSTPIILNNIIIGATYKKEWVSSSRYYNMSNFKEDIKMKLYTSKGSSGTFDLELVKKTNSNIIGLTNSINRTEEYIGIITDNEYNYIPLVNIQKYDSKKVDYISKIKEALGVNKILNSSIQINNVYETFIELGENITLLEVTSSNNSKNGAYASLIMIDSKGKASIIKYNYINNKEKAEDFKIYLLKFAIDLNNDSKNEIVIQEVDEFETIYSVLEYRDNKFITVLSEVIKNN